MHISEEPVRAPHLEEGSRPARRPRSEDTCTCAKRAGFVCSGGLYTGTDVVLLPRTIPQSERPGMGGVDGPAPTPSLLPPGSRPLWRPSAEQDCCCFFRLCGPVMWPPRVTPLRWAAFQGIGKRFSIPGASLKVSKSCGLVWIALIPTESSACQSLHTCQHK